MKRWYVVTTKAGGQDRAEDNLGSQLFEVYNPKIRVETGKTDPQYRLKPLFPRYLFVNFDPALRSAMTVNSTQGVSKIVAFGGELATISEEVIQELKRRVPKIGPTNPLGLTKGQKVVVTGGPFDGIEAVFDEPDGEKRSFIMLQMLGKIQRLTVPNKQLN